MEWRQLYSTELLFERTLYFFWKKTFYKWLAMEVKTEGKLKNQRR
jgi:hypothetical protein